MGGCYGESCEKKVELKPWTDFEAFEDGGKDSQGEEKINIIVARKFFLTALK